MIIFGYDLGISSIGFAVIEEKDGQKQILKMGSRIVPISVDDKNEFSQGQAISKNHQRTLIRQARRNLNRYQMRRLALKVFLKDNNMLPTPDLIHLPKEQLWQLRAKAVTEPVTPAELGRVLYHLNQKRGYKSSRSDVSGNDKKQTEHVQNINNRSTEIRSKKLTVGQYFASNFQIDTHYRTLEQVFMRSDYEGEFDQIIATQRNHYPELLTDAKIDRLRNEIIFYQRKLKSQKGLINICEFEGFVVKDKKTNKDVFTGPRVAPKSSPLHQLSKIWESVNTISITDLSGKAYPLSLEQKKAVVDKLNEVGSLTKAQIFKLLNLNARAWVADKRTATSGLTGDTTMSALKKCFADYPQYLSLLEWNFTCVTQPEREGYLCDKKTGEILDVQPRSEINPDVINTPYYKLWHTIYSISDQQECANALVKHFGFPDDLALNLAKIDFTKQGFANKSAKAIRKIVPYLTMGYVYSEAAEFAGYNHSDSLTKEENIQRMLLDKMPLLKRNSLRQPVVEQILNQMINVTNQLIATYGRPQEIRVELARELKQSASERNKIHLNNSKRDRENKKIVDILNESGVSATRRNIIKYRLFNEIDSDGNRLNGQCVYCGQYFSFAEAMNGEAVDVDHIIPQAVRFDDSQGNKVLVHRHCNARKDKMTAYDFIRTARPEHLEQYVALVNDMLSRKIISKGKRDRLLMTATDIPSDFIERQLRITQYISRKSVELLSQICHHVYVTGGGVTEYLRRLWGWDDVLHQLQFEKYHNLGLTQIVTWEDGSQTRQQERIVNWSKRRDHRHHAIDALVVACTKPGFIQRINTLNSESTQAELQRDNANYDLAALNRNVKRNRLDIYLAGQKPFTTEQVAASADRILISFKAGKRVATQSKRKVKRNGRMEVVQTGLLTPRGALCEATFYGKQLLLEKNVAVALLFKTPEQILKPYIRTLVEQRLSECHGNVNKAKRSLAKNPIYLDQERQTPLLHASCLRPTVVIRKPIDDNIKIDQVVDEGIARILQQRLDECGGDKKKAFAGLDQNPIYLNRDKGITIKTARVRAHVINVEPIRTNDQGEPDAFVNPGNNHHVAIYKTTDEKYVEHICTFWHAVERLHYLNQVIIKSTDSMWDKLSQQYEELPESFCQKLPEPNQELCLSMTQNEMFILGMTPESVQEAFATQDYSLISRYLYRVQKLSKSDYYFRHHLETEIEESTQAALALRYYRIGSFNTLMKLNPVKVRINLIGLPEIVSL